eukprot:gnl/TRDRNA2_/TRDRNA2_190133_c0_seq1.p1 gnl/TRDRNA2_/TRDRNA2_190133_c0~~gnl/TRDRNA2_/TRDRNA2_190133_c0_seq1.p1  ORF type:complete len:320 (+),score=66.95 gnl/TRDRNA2_/TRDRNA2_190133_c0_seq1:202-1161(+)
MQCCTFVIFLLVCVERPLAKESMSRSVGKLSDKLADRIIKIHAWSIDLERTALTKTRLLQTHGTWCVRATCPGPRKGLDGVSNLYLSPQTSRLPMFLANGERHDPMSPPPGSEPLQQMDLVPDLAAAKAAQIQLKAARIQTKAVKEAAQRAKRAAEAAASAATAARAAAAGAEEALISAEKAEAAAVQAKAEAERARVDAGVAAAMEARILGIVAAKEKAAAAKEVAVRAAGAAVADEGGKQASAMAEAFMVSLHTAVVAEKDVKLHMAAERLRQSQAAVQEAAANAQKLAAAAEREAARAGARDVAVENQATDDKMNP